MMQFWKTIIWQQLGGALDMMENAMRACPDEVWHNPSSSPQFWYITYHTLFWLDFHLEDSAGSFQPPAPFTLDEMDPEGIVPERPYTKNELQSYLEHGRQKCRAFISGLTAEAMHAEVAMSSFEGSRGESLLSTLRHVQHHAAQLNLILRQQTNSAPRWVRKTATPL